MSDATAAHVPTAGRASAATTTADQEPGTNQTGGAVAAANALLATLSDAQRAVVSFAFDDAVQRAR